MGQYEIGSPELDRRPEVEKLVHLFTKVAKRTANGHSSKVVSSVRLVKIEITQSGEKVKVMVIQSWLTLCDPWTGVCQAPLCMEFSRKEYWSGWPFPSPGDLPNPGIKAWSPALQADSLLFELPGKPHLEWTMALFNHQLIANLIENLSVNYLKN